MRCPRYLYYTAVLLFFCGVANLAIAQDSTKRPYCGFGAIRLKQGLNNHPQFKTNNPANDIGQYFIIPVVVHIIHNGGPENLPDNLVQTQIDVMNEDFGHYGRGYNTFPMGAVANIRFCLATIDPNGNPTTGIEHIKSEYTDLNSDNEMVTKSLGDWDHVRYLNIWVVKSIDGKSTEAGYAYLASDISSLPDPGADGIIVTYQFFGRNNPYSPAAYKFGRAVTHEAGHYFNLLHTWGGDGPGEGGCNDDDGVDDTPDCDGPYYSTFHAGIKDTCDDPVQCGYLRLVADYMDYSEDRCMDIFTQGQINRMRDAILQYRFSLVTYQNAIATGIQSTYLKYNVATDDAFDISPNPGAGTLNLYPNFAQNETGDLYVYDAMGRLVKHLTLNNMKTEKISIDMVWAANGLYNLVLVTPSQTYKQKWILTHAGG